jgi:hypothetical protein
MPRAARAFCPCVRTVPFVPLLFLASCAPAAREPSPGAAAPPRILGWLDPISDSATDAAPPFTAPAESAPTEPVAPPRTESACREQPPRAEFVRSSYVWRPFATPEEKRARKALHQAAIRFRTRQYGYVDGFGDPADSPVAPVDLSAVGRFLGASVRMNRRVLVALRCVEVAILESCPETDYRPRVLDGLRFRNTFHDGEVSNHLYGIALDLDPNENSCCGCVPPLSEWPVCKDPYASREDLTRIPACWVSQFERFGFYWLGNDALADTMHFEFLGDPSRIEAPAP